MHNIITLLCLDTGKHPFNSAKGNQLQTAKTTI